MQKCAHRGTELEFSLTSGQARASQRGPGATESMHGLPEKSSREVCVEKMQSTGTEQRCVTLEVCSRDNGIFIWEKAPRSTGL